MPNELMIIDDEQIVCTMCKKVLEAEGYQVETFTDSVQALERIKEKRFDVVITDLKMENVDGMDILREVNDRYPDTKVIMLTAYATLDAAIEAIREKIFDFFPKPVKIEELKKAIKKALEV
jgi:DNA-binding NtrC family response regulator